MSYRIPLDDLTDDQLDQLYDRAERTDTAEHERALDNVALHAIARERDAATDAVGRARVALSFAEDVAASSGPAPARAVQAVIDQLRAALDTTPLPAEEEQQP